LTEALVALALLAVASSVLVAAFASGSHALRNTEERTRALHLAQAEVERLRRTPLSELPPEEHLLSRLHEHRLALAHREVLPQSVVVRTVAGEKLSGRFRFEPAGSAVYGTARDDGKRVSVWYEYYAVRGAREEGQDRNISPSVRVRGVYVKPDLSGESLLPTPLKRIMVVAEWTERGHDRQLVLSTLRTE
jgi:hypothetical protein